MDLPKTARSWQELAAAKRESILQSIPVKWRLPGEIPSVQQQRDVTGSYIHQFLSAKEIEITETDAVDIVAKTSVGEWTAVEVTEAFCHRASLAHQLTNCLHEAFFDAALSDAKELDDYYAKHKAPKGLLHGLPVSLKDQFHVKNVETTMGYVGWIDTFEGIKNDKRRGVFESEAVLELRALGAVMYCKTSVPQTLMSGETANNIIGYTWNPTNRNLAAGGATGGEGALIGLKGSPAGFGTDIAGSIRIPAAFNGLYGIKPSAGRLPYEGLANSMDGQNTVLSAVGSFATTARSLKLLIKALLSQSPWLHDPSVVDMPWRDDQENEMLDLVSGKNGKLAIGILSDDGAVGLHPPLRRAIGLVSQKLRELGHVVVEWDPPSHTDGGEIANKTWFYDGGVDVHKNFGLSGETIVPQIQGVYGTQPTREFTASEIAAVNRDLRGYSKAYLDYWNSTKQLTGTGRPVDAFIMPVAPFAGARPERYKYVLYTSIINALAYTSVAFPVTKVDAKIDVVDTSYKPYNDLDRQIQADYDPEIYDGAHVGLQVVGRRYQEEKMLVLAEYLGKAMED